MSLHSTRLSRATLNALTSIAEFGSEHGIDWLTYNPGIVYSFHHDAKKNAPAVIDSILQEYPDAGGFVDVGAGTGVFAAELRRHGRNAVACERSRFGRLLAHHQGVHSIRFDLVRNPPAHIGSEADIAYCFEVGEHLPFSLAEPLAQFISDSAPLSIFTAAHPGQGGVGHINEQPRDYWIDVFQRAGSSYDSRASVRLAQSFERNGVHGQWFAQNVMVFERPDHERRRSGRDGA